MQECIMCGSEIPIYLEEKEDYICIECICKNYSKCSICNEKIGITNMDRANGMLGNNWIDMCEECAIEFKHGKNIN